MSEASTYGPLWDIKYGDNPMTGEYEYVGHRIELPNRKALVFSEKDDNLLVFDWTSRLDAARSLETILNLSPKSPVDFSYYDSHYEDPDKNIILDTGWRMDESVDDVLSSTPEGLTAWRLLFDDDTSFFYGLAAKDERVKEPYLQFGSAVYSIEALKAYIAASAVDDIAMRIDDIIDICEIE